MTGRPTAAMIFAAGFGTRMGALTRNLPKPMLPLHGRPMIDHAVDLARDAGVSKIVSNTHYLAERIEPHLESLGVVTLRETPQILDTGGGLKAARATIGSDPVFTLNPDCVWTGPNPLTCLADTWRPEMQALLLLVPAGVAGRPDAGGDFALSSGRLTRGGPYVYTGAQILRLADLDRIPDDVFSLNRYWDLLAEQGAIHGLVYSGDWQDIGTAEGLARANAKGADDV